MKPSHIMDASPWVAGHRSGGQRGQTSIEMALIMSFVALVVVGSVSLVGPKLLSIFQRVNSNL